MIKPGEIQKIANRLGIYGLGFVNTFNNTGHKELFERF